MDTKTGKIFTEEEIEKSIGGLQNTPDHIVPIDPDEMTIKQAETKQVSKHDSKSKLGKKFTAARYINANIFLKDRDEKADNRSSMESYQGHK